MARSSAPAERAYKGVLQLAPDNWAYAVTVDGVEKQFAGELTARRAADAYDAVVRSQGSRVVNTVLYPSDIQAVAGEDAEVTIDRWREALQAKRELKKQQRPPPPLLYRGVQQVGPKAFSATAYVGLTRKRLGNYETAEEAARAYDVEMRRQGMEVNFPRLPGQIKALPAAQTNQTAHSVPLEPPPQNAPAAAVSRQVLVDRLRHEFAHEHDDTGVQLHPPEEAPASAPVLPQLRFSDGNAAAMPTPSRLADRSALAMPADSAAAAAEAVTHTQRSVRDDFEEALADAGACTYTSRYRGVSKVPTKVPTGRWKAHLFCAGKSGCAAKAILRLIVPAQYTLAGAKRSLSEAAPEREAVKAVLSPSKRSRSALARRAHAPAVPPPAASPKAAPAANEAGRSGSPLATHAPSPPDVLPTPSAEPAPLPRAGTAAVQTGEYELVAFLRGINPPLLNLEAVVANNAVDSGFTLTQLRDACCKPGHGATSNMQLICSILGITLGRDKLSLQMALQSA